MTATTATGADLDAAVLRRRTGATQEHFAVVEEKEKEKPLKPVGGLPGGFLDARVPADCGWMDWTFRSNKMDSISRAW